jgi:hypothetical protein
MRIVNSQKKTRFCRINGPPKPVISEEGWLRKKSICGASPSSLRRTPKYASRGRFCASGPAKRGRAFTEASSLATFPPRQGSSFPGPYFYKGLPEAKNEIKGIVCRKVTIDKAGAL